MWNRIVRSRAAPYLLLAGIALGTLFFRLGALPFVGADECRYARIAQEMNQSGRWVTPLLEGLPWLEKPPLYYWITIPWVRVLGKSEAAARLGPAILALLSVAAIAWLGARLRSQLAGLFGGLILLTSVGFAAFGRSASPDMPFTACLTVAFALMASAVVRGSMPAWQWIFAYGTLGLAVLAKGPAALVLASGIVVLFWVLDETGGSLRTLRILPGLLAVAAVSLPWHLLAFRENGFPFVSVYFINHNLARFVSDLHHHEQPFYYFVPVLLGLFLPWTGWLPVLLPHPSRGLRLHPRAWDRGALFLACWAFVPFLFFSFSSSKLPGYILPSLPPLALLLGMRFAAGTGHREDGAQPRGLRWFYLAVSLCAAAAMPVVLWANYGNAWLPGLPLAAAAAAPAAGAFMFARRGKPGAVIAGTALQGLLIVLAAIQFASPTLAAYHSARGIARQALAAAGGGEEIVTYCYFHHTLNYYTDYRTGPNLLDPPSLLAFARQHASFLVVTEMDRLGDLQGLPGLSVSLIAGQGKLRLLRITGSPAP